MMPVMPTDQRPRPLPSPRSRFDRTRLAHSLPLGVSTLGLLLLTLLLTSCMSKSAYMREKNRADGLSRTLEDYKTYQDGLASQNKKLLAENQKLHSAVDASFDYQKKKEELARLLDEMKKKVQVSGTGKNVEVFTAPNGDTGLRIQGDLLFDSGQAKVTPAGEKTLAGLVHILQESRGVRIAGHSDRDPIQSSPWKSNLHLSAARALSVAQYLQKKGVPISLMSVEGFGASQPIPGASKARNRRVEIFLLK